MRRRSFLCGLALLACCVPFAHAQENVKSLTILHSNDIHAQLLPNEEDRGGLARLATVVRREKANCSACIYLNAGDLVQGSPVSSIYHGLPIYRIANLLGIDVSTLGNHDFDYGWKRTREFVRIANFPIVSANVVNDRGESITGKPYVIKTVGGVRIGIIGEVLSDLVSKSFVSASNVEPWKVLPVLDTVRKYAHELRDRTDIIVVLGHIHDQEEVAEILKTIPEVSVVVAGHTHVEYPQMMNVDGRVGVLVQAYGQELGRLDLRVDVAAKKVISADWHKLQVDSSISPAADVAEAVKKWETKISPLVDVPIGEASKYLNKDDQLKIFRQALLEESKADFVFLDSGTLRGQHDIKPGTIVERQIWSIIPYDNEMVIGTFKGSQLPAVVTAGQTIDPNRDYTFATSDFTAINQASPTQLGTSGLMFHSMGILQRSMLINWIKRKKVIP